MTNVFSGGLVYEYSQEPSGYGLVNIVDSAVTLLIDYTNLRSQFASTPNPTGSGGYTTTNPTAICPGNSSTFSGVWAQDVLPAQPAAAAQYIRNGAGQALGDTGNSQSAGAGAQSNVTAGSPTTSGTASSGTSSASASSTARSSATSISTSSFAALLLIVGVLAIVS